MNITEFVEKRFGVSQKNTLIAIGSGGRNNQKGNRYENYYAVAKICASTVKCLGGQSLTMRSFDRFTVSAQEEALVDDLCIRDLHRRHKINFQAKNSSGRAAAWNEDMRERFARQKIIDDEYFLVKKSLCILVVSSTARAKKNNKKIPVNMRAWCRSEYFPAATEPVALILSHNSLRRDLQKICADTNLQTLDTAFRIIYSAWCSSTMTSSRSLGDIMGEAQFTACPNIFSGLIPARSIPDWLLTKSADYPGCRVAMEFGVLKVRYNGMEIVADNAPGHLPPMQKHMLATLHTVYDFLCFLIALTRHGQSKRRTTVRHNTQGKEEYGYS